MPNKLMVLSVDSLFDEDMDFLRTLPNFGRLLEKGCHVQGGMRSVYPSLTYPCHASLITGTYPAKHGVHHNEMVEVGNPLPPWFWFHQSLKAETVIDAAKKAGLTTSTVLWPVMAACPSCDYNIAEVWADEPEGDPRINFGKGNSANMMTTVFERHRHKLRWKVQPYFDSFGIGCAVDIIREYTPDVMFIHLAHLDHTRHANGVHNDAVQKAILANDEWLGRLMEAYEDAGVADKTNFVVLSDHGHLEVEKVFNPNIILAEHGLIDLDEEGNVTSWRAYCHSASLSSQVFLQNPEDTELRALVESLLYSMRRNPAYGVEAVFTIEELRRDYQLDGPFSYVLEGKERTSFGNHCTGPILIDPDNSDYKFSVTSHGHLPHKGTQPVFLASGPGFREGAVVSNARVVDVAPTLAKLLGFSMPQAQGEALEGLLR